MERYIRGVTEGEGNNMETELHTLRIQTGGIATSPKEDSREGESKASSPRGKKRAASEDLEAEMPKQAKKASPRGSAVTGALTTSCPPMGQPSIELRVNH